MSYVQDIIGAGEVIEYRARLTWVQCLPAVIMLIVPPIGIALLIAYAVRQMTTEVVVTNWRLIYKTGLIRRTAIDLPHNKVETVALHQSIPGRLLGFGTLVVHGTGVGAISIADIDAPQELRRKLQRR